MNSISINSSVYRKAEEYAHRRNLSLTELVERALSSLIGQHEAEAAAADDPFACFSGDWGGNRSAHEIANDLRTARNFENNDEAIFA